MAEEKNINEAISYALKTNIQNPFVTTQEVTDK
jgi:hypothetical protein